MGNQRTFASLAWNGKGKVRRRERFLAEMDAVIRWSRLVRLIEPHYPKAGQGRQPLGLEKMLRIYFLQQWFNLSDPQAEDAIYDSESMRRFARVELGDEVVPDESTILRFRHLLEQHGLTHAIFDAVADLLEERRLLLRSGTIVDATIIAAPSSTKNASASRDPEMKQTRKGRNWHFGMKLNIGADKRGIVHRLRATAASVADITQLPDLLHGQEREVFGDQAYWKEDDREFLEAWGMRYRINRRPTSNRLRKNEQFSVDYIVGWWPSVVWGGSGDARDGPSAVFDVQLHFGGAAGAQGSSVACAAGDGGCGARAVGAGFRCNLRAQRAPLDRAGEIVARALAAGAVHGAQRAAADRAARLQLPVPLVRGAEHRRPSVGRDRVYQEPRAAA